MLQSWQIIDEFNRSFSQKPPSGFKTKPILVTKKLLESIKNGEIDENIDYKKAYLKIWFPNK